MHDGSAFAQFFEVADRLRRHWWVPVAGVCLGLAGGLLALRVLPRSYEASTRIVVAPPRIPEEFVKSTVTDDLALRIAALREAMLSRANIDTLIDKYYGPVTDDAAREALLGAIRERFVVRASSMQLGRNLSAGFFELIFRDNDPHRAAGMVNSLAELYINENTRFRTNRAGEATRTLEHLAENLRRELQTRERAIAGFRTTHVYQDGTQIESNLRLLEARQHDLDTNQKVLQAAQDRLVLVRSRGALLRRVAGAEDARPGSDPYESRRARLERELAELRTRYLDDHPDVKAKRRDLDEWLARAAEPQPDRVTAAAAGPSRGDAETTTEEEAVRMEIARLGGEQERIRADVAQYAKRIEDTPRIDQQLTELTKGYDVLADRYRDYRSKVESAKGAQTIEDTQQGEHFQVLEPAVAARIPVEPKPTRVIGLGLLAGLCLTIGPLLLRDVFEPRMRSERLASAQLELPVLAAIPRLVTPEARASARKERLFNVGASAASIAVLALALIAAR